MRDPIEQYLQEHAGEGVRDSSGVFTISAEKALAKMASYKLPRPSSWLLKMVQAGVAGAASEIAVSQTNRSARITFHGGSFGTLKELVALCSDPQAMVTPAQEHLLTGLRSVAMARQRPVLIQEEPAEGGAQTAFWCGPQVSPLRPASSSGTRLFRQDQSCLSFHVGDSPLSQFAGNKRRSNQAVVAEEYHDLCCNAVACPVPLKLDVRRLDHFGLDDVSFHRMPLLFGADAAPSQEVGFPLSPAVRLDGGDAEMLYRAAWTVYLTDQSRPSEICWVKDGVVCQSDKIAPTNSPFMLRLFLSAQDFPTDLTGLQLRFPDGERRGRIRKGLAAFAASAPALSSSKPLPFRAKHAPQRSTSWWGGAALAVGGVLLAPVTLGGGALLGLTGLLGMSSSSRDDQRRYEEEIRERLPRWAGVMARISPS